MLQRIGWTTPEKSFFFLQMSKFILQSALKNVVVFSVDAVLFKKSRVL
jgi:hypothetical protein